MIRHINIAIMTATKLVAGLNENEEEYSISHRYSDIIQHNEWDCGIHLLQFAKEAQEHFCAYGRSFDEFYPTIGFIRSEKARKIILKRIKMMFLRSVNTNSPKRAHRFISL